MLLVLLLSSIKSNGTFSWLWQRRGVSEFSDLFQNIDDSTLVGVDSPGELLFKVFQFAGKIDVCIERLPHPDERTDNENAHLHSSRTAKYVRSHDRAMFGEDIWTKTDVAFGCGRILRPDAGCALFADFFPLQLEAKVRRESLLVPFDLLVQALRRYAVQNAW